MHSFLQIRKHQKYIDVSTGAKNSLAKFGFGLIKLWSYESFQDKYRICDISFIFQSWRSNCFLLKKMSIYIWKDDFVQWPRIFLHYPYQMQLHILIDSFSLN